MERGGDGLHRFRLRAEAFLFLADLFARGQRDTSAGLAARLDAGPLGFGELLGWVREGLGGRS